ncbi:myosin heavy chain [Anaeramoeba flamelloides]|uniref:Myosin heavy chain n=1 Tax=Anaeramoeba flamelloides TaxID=1746091 RepID=A0ABQ8ZBM3_9EUKA|nr:myosin heavy chain [Anaeramoeba flamelloides]
MGNRNGNGNEKKYKKMEKDELIKKLVEYDHVYETFELMQKAKQIKIVTEPENDNKSMILTSQTDLVQRINQTLLEVYRILSEKKTKVKKDYVKEKQELNHAKQELNFAKQKLENKKKELQKLKEEGTQAKNYLGKKIQYEREYRELQEENQGLCDWYEKLEKLMDTLTNMLSDTIKHKKDDLKKQTEKIKNMIKTEHENENDCLIKVNNDNCNKIKKQIEEIHHHLKNMFYEFKQKKDELKNSYIKEQKAIQEEIMELENKLNHINESGESLNNNGVGNEDKSQNIKISEKQSQQKQPKLYINKTKLKIDNQRNEPIQKNQEIEKQILIRFNSQDKKLIKVIPMIKNAISLENSVIEDQISTITHKITTFEDQIQKLYSNLLFKQDPKELKSKEHNTEHKKSLMENHLQTFTQHKKEITLKLSEMKKTFEAIKQDYEQELRINTDHKNLEINQITNDVGSFENGKPNVYVLKLQQSPLVNKISELKKSLILIKDEYKNNIEEMDKQFQESLTMKKNFLNLLQLPEEEEIEKEEGKETKNNLKTKGRVQNRYPIEIANKNNSIVLQQFNDYESKLLRELNSITEIILDKKTKLLELSKNDNQGQLKKLLEKNKAIKQEEKMPPLLEQLYLDLKLSSNLLVQKDPISKFKNFIAQIKAPLGMLKRNKFDIKKMSYMSMHFIKKMDEKFEAYKNDILMSLKIEKNYRKEYIYRFIKRIIFDFFQTIVTDQKEEFIREYLDTWKFNLEKSHNFFTEFKNAIGMNTIQHISNINLKGYDFELKRVENLDSNKLLLNFKKLKLFLTTKQYIEMFGTVTDTLETIEILEQEVKVYKQLNIYFSKLITKCIQIFSDWRYQFSYHFSKQEKVHIDNSEYEILMINSNSPFVQPIFHQKKSKKNKNQQNQCTSNINNNSAIFFPMITNSSKDLILTKYLIIEL